MTTQPIVDPYYSPYAAPAVPAPSRPIALRLPPVRPRPALAVPTGRIFTTLAEYVELTHHLRVVAAHA
jgi:hypothetical protein